MEQSNDKLNGQVATPFAQTYFHGTRIDLKVGDLIEVGFNSNYGKRKNAKYIFLTATLLFGEPNLQLAKDWKEFI